MAAVPAEVLPAQTTQVAQAVQQASRPSLIAKFAGRFGVEPAKVLHTLKVTAFKQRADRDGTVREVTNEEMMALLIIADQYNLNPFTREIFAFFDRKNGAIVPVVSVDGWSRIINEHQQLNGVTFTYSAETVEHKGKVAHVWIECQIHRKDRAEPVAVREFFDEVCRTESFATPWDTHPKRMHRHKTLIQCARLAFGFAGIYDEDEAQRVAEQSIAFAASASNDAIDALNAQIKPAAIEHNPSPALAPATVQQAETVQQEPAQQQAQQAQPQEAPPAAADDKRLAESALADYLTLIREAATIEDVNVNTQSAHALFEDGTFSKEMYATVTEAAGQRIRDLKKQAKK